MHTANRIACPLTTQCPLMFSGCQSVHHSRLWEGEEAEVGQEEERINSVVLRLRCHVGMIWLLSLCRPHREGLRGHNREVSEWV